MTNSPIAARSDGPPRNPATSSDRPMAASAATAPASGARSVSEARRVAARSGARSGPVRDRVGALIATILGSVDDVRMSRPSSAAGRGDEVIPSGGLPESRGACGKRLMAGSDGAVRFGQVGHDETDLVAWPELADQRKVGRDHDGSDPVATGRLMIGRQDDRPAVGRDLDRSPRYAVGQGLAAELGRERAALETHTDAIRGRGDAPRPVGEGIRAVVRAWQRAKGDRLVVASGAVRVLRGPHQLDPGWPATVRGVRGPDLVARPDGPAVEPAEPAGQAGRPGAEHDRDVDATGDGQVATGSATRPPASAGSLEGDLIAGRDPVAASHAETPPTDDAPAEVGPGQPDQAAGSGAQP